ncbi:hypothetical protein F2Q70_00041649 [Brassica cretica]|uniref:Chlorophyll a-b binding protein, chloroplastic n=1 Tax=Brassica cretica TaxID=69181 RepID=A0A8S9K741_BRACR|nr:hypothetical protein F2Q70_00041649 [Brassica cretica]
MAMAAVTGAVLSGLGSSFLSGGKRSITALGSGVGTGAARVGRKTLIVAAAAAQPKKSWIPAVKGGGNFLDPEWLDGSLPGDFGFDPLGLGKDPAFLKWYREAELIHGRWAMAARLYGWRGGGGQESVFINFIQRCPKYSYVSRCTSLVYCRMRVDAPVTPMAGFRFGEASSDRSANVVSIQAMNGDARNMVDVKPVITEESNDKSKIWKLTEISRLIFTNSGNAILALASNAIHLLWKWQRNERNATGKATASLPPQQWQPASGILMTNDAAENNPEEAVPCFALSKNDSYVMSASGGKISLFNMMTFKTMATFMPPPPAATFLAFHPQDNNIIAIGMDDSTIQIYNVRVDEVKSKLKGHSKRITGLAFSNVLNVLVSSGADAQLCVWNTDGWEKQRSKVLPLPQGRPNTAPSDTRVQFHQDQAHFLVVHETQLAIYETTKLECMKQWPVRESSAPITHATFSCDSQLVYASFMDATICVFSSANLRLRCRVNPSAYLPASLR